MNENPYDNDVTPDDLMSDFRGKGIFGIFIFTFLVHAVVLLGSSVPWMMETLFSSVDDKASEEERIKEAVREATGSLRDIAEKYGIHPEELSSQFTKKDKTSQSGKQTQEEAEPSTLKTTTPVTSTEPEEPKSAIQKELEVKATGPALPAVPNDTEEDLFK